jgi:hypothetical protein
MQGVETTQQVGPLLWTPWYASRVADDRAIKWVWPIIQDVCQLPDPKRFPVLDHAWTPAEITLLERYAQVSKRLVDTTVFASNARVQVSLFSGAVTKVVPADDATLGFAALLRQLFHHTEEASFDKVRQLLSRGDHDRGAEAAEDVLRLWRTAHGTLLNQHLMALVESMARNRGLLGDQEESNGGRPFLSEEITPKDLVDTFLYGDQLHYGKGREALDRWQQDEATAAMMEINMRTDAQTLAHFYAGFGGIVRVVLQRAGQDPDG